MNRRLRRFDRPAEHGVAMIIVLLLLLTLAGLTIFSARYATMSEGISRNQLDAERARQAAESALRDAERDLLLPAGAVPTGALCSRGAARPSPPLGDLAGFWNAQCLQGQCAPSATAVQQSNWVAGTDAESWWPSTGAHTTLWNNNFNAKPRGGAASCTFNGGVPLGTFTGAPAVAGVARQPEYLIEYFLRGTETFYRITARGFGALDQTQVVLQSYFQPYVDQ